MGKRVNRIMNIMIVFLLFIITILSIEVLKIKKDKTYVPSFMSYIPLTVLSDSMFPLFQEGDVIIVKKINYHDLKENDIITYKDEEKLITHRIVKKIKLMQEGEKRVDVYEEGKGEDAFITKGDANAYPDGYFIPIQDVVGKYCFRLKGR